MRRWKLLTLLALAGSLVAAAPALAVSSLDVQANNPQVAGDPTSNTTARFPTNKSNEPSIAVNPTNASLLIAGANDEQREPPCGPGPVRGADAARNDCSFFPNIGSDGVYTSSDGGATWVNRGLLPGFSDTGGRLVSDGDPFIVYGPKPAKNRSFSYKQGARAYYAGIASYAVGQEQGNQAPEFLTVSTSDDNGKTWSNPVVAVDGRGHDFNDHESIWADDNPSSPFFGRVYIAWADFRSVAETASPIEVTYSADGGKTWAAPDQISVSHNNAAVGGRQDAYVRSGPDGTAYVVWDDGDKNGAKMVISTSSDGGVTWTHSSTIAYFDNLRDPIPGANFRDATYPTLAVDPTSGALYVAWADELGSLSARIVMAKSTDRGLTWSAPVPVTSGAEGYAFFQGLDVATNGRVDLGYQALKAKSTATYGTGNATIDSYYVSSTDGGRSWSGPVKVNSVSSDPAASSQNNLERQFWGDYNTIVSSNANAWFIYTDSRNGVGCAAVDAYQHGVDGSGPAVAKPAPEDVCPAQFGNSDTFVSTITP